MSEITHKARIYLIRLGKVIPFFLCFVVLISYTEALMSLISCNYVLYGEHTLVNQNFSWMIGTYFEYNIPMLIVISIISIAIRTCVYNKLAIIYLAINLYEKSYFTNHVYENNIYYIVAIVNSLICAFFCYKGIKILLK